MQRKRLSMDPDKKASLGFSKGNQENFVSSCARMPCPALWREEREHIPRLPASTLSHLQAGAQSQTCTWSCVVHRSTLHYHKCSLLHCPEHTEQPHDKASC